LLIAGAWQLRAARWVSFLSCAAAHLERRQQPMAVGCAHPSNVFWYIGVALFIIPFIIVFSIWRYFPGAEFYSMGGAGFGLYISLLGVLPTDDRIVRRFCGRLCGVFIFLCCGSTIGATAWFWTGLAFFMWGVSPAATVLLVIAYVQFPPSLAFGAWRLRQCLRKDAAGQYCMPAETALQQAWSTLRVIGGGSHFVHLVLVLIAGSLCSFKLDDIWFGRNWFGGQIAHGAGWGLLPLVLTERNRVYIYERFAANFKLKPITEVMQMQYVGSAYKV